MEDINLIAIFAQKDNDTNSRCVTGNQRLGFCWSVGIIKPLDGSCFHVISAVELVEP